MLRTIGRPVRTNVAEKAAGGWVRIATCGGVGLAPIAPGTAGSLVGLVVAAAVGRVPLSVPWPGILLAGLTLVTFLVGVRAAGDAEKFFGGKDPGQVVFDEVVGQMLTFLARPGASWVWLVAGFLLFRFFDIVKPFPARRAERLPGGWGVMVDDIVAGLYSLAALAIVGHLQK